jgi:hypothetical protein
VLTAALGSGGIKTKINMKHFSLTSLNFYLTVIALVGICMCWDRFINSEDRVEIKSSVVYASNESVPGEQVSPTVTATPTVTPNKLNREDSVGVSESPTPAPVEFVDKTIDVKRQICDVFKSDCDRALAVAKAESGFNPQAKNKHSTATGIFQIIRGTWKLYKCEGERTNAMDNIKCAKKIYDRNHGKFNTTGGWSASFHAHQQD